VRSSELGGRWQVAGSGGSSPNNLGAGAAFYPIPSWTKGLLLILVLSIKLSSGRYAMHTKLEVFNLNLGVPRLQARTATGGKRSSV